MHYVFVDLEMNPLEKRYKEFRKICRNEIIEIGAVMLDECFREEKQFKCYVKPEYAVTVAKNITRLTGITNQMLSEAESIQHVLPRFLQWCEECHGEYMVYAWSDSDLHQIKAEMIMKNMFVTPQIEKIFACWRDYQKEYCDLIHLEKVTSLDRAVYLSGQAFEGEEHDALWDAKNTANLFVLAQDSDKLVKTVEKIRHELEDIEHITYTLGDVFDFDLFDSQEE